MKGAARICAVLVITAVWGGGLGHLFSQDISEKDTQEKSQEELKKADSPLGSLDWIDEGQRNYGVVRHYRGWLERDSQDCAQPRKRRAGDAWRLCNARPGAVQAQEYINHFAYMPDTDAGKFPFGVPLNFMLRLVRVMFAEKDFWQIQLISYSPKNKIIMYQHRLDGPQNGADRKWRANLHRKLEREAYHFLYQYFTCLRQGEESCGVGQ